MHMFTSANIVLIISHYKKKKIIKLEIRKKKITKKSKKSEKDNKNQIIIRKIKILENKNR